MNWNKFQKALFWIFLAALFPVPSFARDEVHHDLKVGFEIGKNRMAVEDTIRLPQSMTSSGKQIRFILHRGLGPFSKTEGVRISPLTQRGNTRNEETETFFLTVPPGIRDFNLSYQGKIFHAVPSRTGDGNSESGNVFGTVSEMGIFLAGGTFWYPVFGSERVTFRLEIELPSGWDAVSQGKRSRQEATPSRRITVWESPYPQEEIFLVGGKFTEYAQGSDGVKSMVFLRIPDPELAGRYLEVTGPYIDMYGDLIGPYPYGKFALVENFWETGYGMPSFTLMGSRVIRFPFILHSSYPHEILHNWWGNGVYLDASSGNWSEGLTTYLADHLFKEQEGKGHEFRRDALQRYADYVAESKDFPLTRFTSRDSPATQAVGYGKTMMLFHMLRQRLGDETFIEALRSFYEAYRFRRASFEDIEKVFSKTVGEDLNEDFSQWVERAGAPQLNVQEVSVEDREEGSFLKGVIEQLQAGPAYQLQLPVAVHLENRDRAFQTLIPMDRKKIDFELSLPGRPFRFELDPEFDLFRRLDPEEIPSALSGSFGTEKILFILPSDSPEELQKGFKVLAEMLASRSLGEVAFKSDSEVEALPDDHAVWLLGWDNKLLQQFIPLLENNDASLESNKVKVLDEVFRREENSFVFTVRHPRKSDLTLTWIGSDHLKAFSGLGRKLPHYGKYSYLVFEGDDPANILRGQWPVRSSPLSVLIPKKDGSLVSEEKADLKPRRPLAQRPAFRQAGYEK